MRVLVVEDELPIADFLLRGLREEGCVCDHAADGDEARERIGEEVWDVVLLDWSLPRRSGLEVLHEYRAGGGRCPVLFLTARDAVSERIEGLDGGADDYLCKPFAFDELLARMRALARRHDQWQDAVVTYADVRVDLANHTAERAGQRLDLTVKEEALLAIFLRSPGRLFGRTLLYERVWDERYDGLSNTLEVHVMALRRKLEAHGPRLIHTLRGRGYVLESRPEHGEATRA